MDKANGLAVLAILLEVGHKAGGVVVVFFFKHAFNNSVIREL